MLLKRHPMAMLAVDFTVFTQYIAGDIAGMAININFLVSQKLLLYYSKGKQDFHLCHKFYKIYNVLFMY